jgi:PIN domain nuclease of toxin-antitoxin system
VATRHFVDTHAFLWYLAGSAQLGSAAKAILQDPTSELYIPATALAEACWIVERGRVALTVSDVLTAIDNDPRITILPLDRSVIERSNGLTAIGEMHDRQIVATALVLQDQGETVDLLTKDGNITASGLVAIVW